jgi:hypothetical protein
MLLSRGYGHLLHLKGQALMDELRRQGGLDEEELVMLQYMLCDYRERVSSEALRSKSRVLQRAAYDLEQLQRSADSRDAHMTQLDAEVQKEREEGLLRLPQHLQRSVPPIQWGEQRTPSGVAGAFGPGGILQAPLGVQPLQPVLAEQQWQQQPIRYVPVGGVHRAAAAGVGLSMRYLVRPSHLRRTSPCCLRHSHCL